MVHINDNTYKAVIALNNSGVALLQHRRYMEGLLTFKDALILMKLSLQSDDTSLLSSSSSLQQQDQVNVALQCAWHRTSQMHGDKILSQNTDIVVVTNQDNPFEVYNNLERNPGTLCCVKIDPMEWEGCYPDSEKLNFELSIIMYNYGVAHLLASLPSRTSGDDAKDVYAQTSYHLFELAQNVIDVHITSADEFYVPSDILLLAMLTGTCLYQLSTLALHDRATTNLICLEWVLMTIFTQERVNTMLSPCTAACA